MRCEPRWATQRTIGRRTLGSAAAKVADALGTPLMDWQRQVLDVALEVDDRGKLFYREVILTVPRQSGKTTLLLSLMLSRALAEKIQIRYTAQTGADARKKLLDDWLPNLQNTWVSSAYTPRLTNGHEALRFRNGSHVGLVATTQRAGHGQSLDLAIVDEAFAQPDARLEQALKPTLVTRPNPQFWVVSTAGTPGGSPYLWDKVANGRQIAEAGVTKDVAYFEWSADPDADPADEATWWSCMPALGKTAPLEAIRADFKSIADLWEFRRAYLNQWTTAASEPVIPLAQWNDLEDRGSALMDPVSLSVDSTPDRDHTTSIVAAGRREDGLAHVEVVEHRRGNEWVEERVRELVARWNIRAIVVDQQSTAAGLVHRLADQPVEIVAVNGRQYSEAYEHFLDAVTGGQLRHLGQPDLLAALDGAAKRPLGEAFAWSRKNSGVDISPLVAATLALWHADSNRGRGAEVWDLAAMVAQEVKQMRDDQRKAAVT